MWCVCVHLAACSWCVCVFVQVLVAEGQFTLLDSIFNNRSIALPELTDPYETGYEMYLTRGMREWNVDETGLLATVQPAAEFDLPLEEKWRLSLVNDQVKGPKGTSPSWLLVMGDYLYFTSDTPEYGVELWRSNGTTPGYELVKDIYPGKTSSSPKHLTLIDSTHFLFSADGVSTNWMNRDDSVGTLLLLHCVCLVHSPCALSLFLSFFLSLSFTRCVTLCWQCTGFRRSTVDIRMPYGDQFPRGGRELDMSMTLEDSEDVAVFYAVSESATWIPGSVYDCPSGYHWASTAEGQAYFTGQREGTGAYRPFPVDGTSVAVTV